MGGLIVKYNRPNSLNFCVSRVAVRIKLKLKSQTALFLRNFRNKNFMCSSVVTSNRQWTLLSVFDCSVGGN